jgi:hypothetical protein
MLWREEKNVTATLNISSTLSLFQSVQSTKVKFFVMHVVMNMLRGIPDTCVALGTSSVLVFLYCAQEKEGQ